MTFVSSGAANDELPERICIVRCSSLPGVELKTVENATHLWRVFHDRHTLVSTISGSSARRFAGRVIERVPGQLMLYEPGDFHANTHFSAGSAFHVVSFDARVLSPWSDEPGLGGRHFNVSQLSSATLAVRVASLADAMTDPDPAQPPELAFAALIDELAPYSASAESSRGEALSREMSLRLRDRLHADLTGEHALDELSRELGLNKFRLLRAFKHDFGASPSAYRQAIRVARARRLLQQRYKPSQVSALLGFADFSHFRRTFMKYGGMTPSQYVKGDRL